MANEHDDKFEGHEEGEYHFTDDSLNYEEIENEPPKAAEPVVKKPKENPLNKLTQPKRMLISVAVFFGLIFIVYKMLAPSTPTAPTDFAPNAVSKPMTNLTPKTPKPLVPIVQTAATTPSAPAPSAEQINPVAAPPPPGLSFNPAPTPSAAPAQPVQAPVAPAPAPSMAAPIQTVQTVQPTMPPRAQPAVAQAAQPELTQVAVPQAPPAMPPQQAMMAPSTMNPPPAPPRAEMTSEQSKIITEKLAALEEENAKMISMMQNQFAQKISEVQSQSNESQDRVQALNRRLSNIEASMNKMAQLLREEGVAKRPPPPPPGIPPSRPVEVRTAYIVQAIIPGRAWLKSDSGDTVTVAEGDLLKDYGRVTKIDPYDGVVDIDTGSKIIVLSYGTSND